jgi:hypothetical protein
MDSIPFEKVSIQDAKEALDKEQPSTQRKNWTNVRPPTGAVQDAGAPLLATATLAWAEQLPAHLKPTLLTANFPRIANRIAEMWKRPLYCEKYLDDLVLDARGGRQGFPPAVASEIANLKIHLVTNVMTVHVGVWGERIGGDYR